MRFTPKIGRYVVFYAPTVGYSNANSAQEVWVYGNPDTTIASFTVTDSVSGNPYLTTNTTVETTLIPAPAAYDITGYMINESGNEPGVADPGWSSTPIEFYNLEEVEPGVVEEGLKTLYAWVKDSNNQVLGAVGWIVYSSAAPNITDIQFGEQQPYSINVGWWPDAESIGWVEYREVGTDEWLISEPSEYTDMQHDFLITGLLDNTDYQLVFRCNNTVVDELENEPIIVTTGVAAPTEDDVVWSGAAAPDDTRWARGGNWKDGQAPLAATDAKLSFTDEGIGTSSITEVRSVGALEVMTDAGVHTIDLQTNKLTIGDLTVGDNTHLSQLEIINGNLSLNNVTVNSHSIGFSRVKLSNVVLDSDVNTITVGDPMVWSLPLTPRGELDLTEATIAGGTLRAVNFWAGRCYDRNNPGTYPQGMIYISESTGLENLIVTGTFGIAHGHYIGACRFGDPSTDETGNRYKLPPDVNITVGVDAGNRGNMYVGYAGYDAADGYLAASDGGEFNAWLSILRVGCKGRGEVDFAAMTGCQIDSNHIGVSDDPARGTVVARLALPKGNVRANTLTVGRRGTASLELFDTVTVVEDAVLIGNDSLTVTANVEINVGGFASGLDLKYDTTTLDIQNGGKIQINFLSDPDPEATERHWGLRWTGDKEAELLAYQAAGKLDWNDAAMSVPAFIYYQDGYTYVGLKGLRDMEFTSLSVVGPENYWHTNVSDVNLLIEVLPARDNLGIDIPIDKIAVQEAYPGDPEPTLDGTETWIDWSGTNDVADIPYPIQGGEGTVTLHVWVQNDAGHTVKADGWIRFTTYTPEIVNVAPTPEPFSFTVAWDTEDDTGNPVDAISWIQYRVAGSSDPWITVGPGDYGTSHFFEVVRLLDLTGCDVILRSDNTILDDPPLLITTTEQPPTQDDVVWLGAAAPDVRWSRGGNWAAGYPPAVETEAVVTFLDDGLGVNRTLEDRSVGTLDVHNTQGMHTFDVDGNKLTVTGTMRVGNLTRVTETLFTNGELAPRNLYVDSDGTGWSKLTLDNVVLHADSDVFSLADPAHGAASWQSVPVRPGTRAEVDLTNATIAGGTINAVNFWVGRSAGRENPGNHPRAMLLIDDSAGLTDINVTGIFGIAHGHYIGICRFGDESNGYKLPDDVNITLGDRTEEVRGNMIVGRANYGSPLADGYLGTTGGGVFDALLNEMQVGYTAKGHVELASMSSCNIDVLTMSIGNATTNWMPAGYPDAKLTLPSGNATVADLLMASTGKTTWEWHTGAAVLELNDTSMVIESSMVLANDDLPAMTATVIANVLDEPSGLDILEGAAVTVASLGTIRINFLEIPSDSSARHYGLRWEGDNVATLEVMRDADTANLVVDISAVQAIDPNASWDIVYDDVENATYLVLNAAAPDYSTYEFSFDVPEPVYAGVDTVVPVTFANTIEGTLSYSNVRFEIEASGPGDVTFTATDDELAEHTFTNSGKLAPG